MEVKHFGKYLLRKEKEVNLLVAGDYEVILNDKATKFLEKQMKNKEFSQLPPQKLLEELQKHKNFKVEPLWFYFCRQVARCGKKRWFNEA